MNVYDRTEKLIGGERLQKLKNSRVIVFGVGGVGGYVVEAFARTGIGSITIVDYDIVDITNINRQLIALHSTIGKYKVDVFKDRILDINGEISVTAFKERLTFENVSDFCFGKYDYIVDAVDDVKAKLVIIETAKSLGIPVISSMGTGNKIDPSKFKIADISKTHTCPLAKKVRKEIALRGIKGVKVLFSDELPKKIEGQCEYPASIAFVPAAAGILIAGEIVHDLLV